MEAGTCPTGGCPAAGNRARLLQLSSEAQEAARQGDLDRAVERVEEFLDLEGADRFWGLGFLQTLLGQMAQSEEDPELRDALDEQQKALRARLLAMEAPDENWAHAWERARQHNQSAWEVAARGADRRELLDALAEAGQSVAFWPYFLAHQDTRVRLLLRLGRMHEAFAAARWVRAIQPDWPDFEDIWSNPDYLAWEEAHCGEQPALPPGPASLAEVVTRLAPGQTSDPGRPLNQTERVVLRHVRVGGDEWHRARNCALLAVLLDGDLAPEAWLAMRPQRLDLSRGLLLEGEQAESPIPADTVEKLRHWLLYAANNHPAAKAPRALPGIRMRLFLRYDLQGVTMDDLEALLGAIGERLGIAGLGAARFRKDPGSAT